MISSLIDMSMPATRFPNVSKKSDFMDTLFKHVHAGDMFGRIHPVARLDGDAAADRKEIGYGD